MDVAADSSLCNNSYARDRSFAIKQACDETIHIATNSDDAVVACYDNTDVIKTLIVDNGRMKNKKHKPPKLSISHSPDVETQEESASPTGVDAIAENLTPNDPVSVVLRKRGTLADEVAGRNSPVVKRSSMLEKILEIPDVKAALVKDEGYVLRRHSHEISPVKPCSNRQPTPACNRGDDHFSFDQNSVDFDSESVSESDTSSIHSSHDAFIESNINGRRPHAEVLKENKRVANPFERIADSTGPSVMFGSPLKKNSPSIPSPRFRKRRRKKTYSTDEDDDVMKPTTPSLKSRALLSRLKFGSMGRSESTSSLEGWDSLARALARVGATSPSLSALDIDPTNLHPKLSPILKRNSPVQRWSSESSCSFQVLAQRVQRLVICLL